MVTAGFACFLKKKHLLVVFAVVGFLCYAILSRSNMVLNLKLLLDSQYYPKKDHVHLAVFRKKRYFRLH